MPKAEVGELVSGLKETCVIEGRWLAMSPIHLVTAPTSPHVPRKVSLNRMGKSGSFWQPEVYKGQWLEDQRILH